ncbi:MAG TPA: hypothetical protein DC049_14185 [Spirochaetia bacterium]|nr:hypothetical protein [Spirochaetia bacterium]
MNRAYSEITRQNEAVVVEGYMDVIACHQHGIPRAVAPLGTALTREQIIKLKRYSRKIILLFDGDSAGQAAARRAAPLVMEAECEGFVLVLPDNLDPFDYLNKYGTEAFLNYKKEHEKNIYDFLIESTIPSRRLSADEKSNIYRETLHPLLKAAHNPLVHDEFLKKICQALDTPREVIDRYGSELDSVSRPALIRKTGEKLTPEQIYRKNTELDFAVFLCKNPSCAEKAFYIIDPAALQDPAARLIYSKILDISGRNPTLLEILGLFSGEKIREFITEKIHKNEKKYSPEQEDGIENLLDEYIYKIKKFQLAEKLAEISLKIREAGFSDDDEMKKQLLEEKIYLINEREKLKKIING